MTDNEDQPKLENTVANEKEKEDTIDKMKKAINSGENDTIELVTRGIFILGVIIGIMMYTTGSSFKESVSNIFNFVRGLDTVEEDVRERSLFPGGFDFTGQDTLDFFGIGD